MALNSRQERFAELIALGGLPFAEAARRAGYSGKVAGTFGSRLAKNVLVASRIDALRSEEQAKLDKRQAKTEVKLQISRDLIVQELANMATAKGSNMVKLKAIELLSKMQGYNEPSAVQHSHVHMHVDAGLIAELRAGHAALLARESKKHALPMVGATLGGGGREEGVPQEIKDVGPAPVEGGPENIHTPEIEPPVHSFLHTPNMGFEDAGYPIPR